MQAKDALRSSTNLSSMVLKSYISDLEDADLMRRPTEGCNHLAWQLGHLISAEVNLLEMFVGGSGIAGSGIELPEGFAAAHSKEQCGNDNPEDFCGKEEYVDLFDKVRAASLKVLEEFPEADLDKPAPEHFASICPTLGDLFNLIASHPMMHAGQFAVVRRQLGKPILI